MINLFLFYIVGYFALVGYAVIKTNKIKCKFFVNLDFLERGDFCIGEEVVVF
jgi:hypothetical protein